MYRVYAGIKPMNYDKETELLCHMNCRPKTADMNY